MTPEHDSEAVRRHGWRFDRSISLGHIFTATSIALSIAVPLVIWGSTVESRLSVLQTVHGLLAAHQERVAEDLKERLDREAMYRAETLGDIKATLRRIEEKVDRKADRPLPASDNP